VKVSLRFRINNQLKKADYRRLREFLNDNSSVSIELLPGADFECVALSPVVASVEGFGYKITAEIMLRQPIGLQIYDELEFDAGTRSGLAVNRRSLKLTKMVTEGIDFAIDLNKLLTTVARIVNHVCSRFGTLVEQTFLLSSEWLDRQLDMILEREELRKRGERPRPFGTIHAMSAKKAKEHAGDLIPLHKEHDKTYLYDAKRVYHLLPQDFVANLLRCDEATMIREEEFDERGREVLRDLVYKKRLRRHETTNGMVCYYNLSEKTRRFLRKYLKRRTSAL
jgi:hypothetical protein